MLLTTSAPAGARILFDGDNLDAWTTLDGEPADWEVVDGALWVRPGAGDIRSRDVFGDSLLHLEFCCPPIAGARGQDRSNSGVFLQGRYEIQILDSYGANQPGTGDCGAIYELAAPLSPAYRPAGQWQALDVLLRAAREHQPAFVSVFLNGLPIHNNLPLTVPTKGAMSAAPAAAGPLRLQDHRDRVGFRNIWLLPLPPHGPPHYQG